MTATYRASGGPPPLAAHRRRTALAVAGAIMTALGGLAASAAAAVIVAFGSGGTLDSGVNRVSTSTAALVTDVAAMQDVAGIAGITGSPTLRMSATSTGPAGVFIGVGPADAVTEYLSGVAVDRVTDLSVDPFRLGVAPESGRAAALPPADEDFWVDSATSASVAEFGWTLRDGDYRLVVMNADRAPGLTSMAQVRVELPHAFPVSLTVLFGSGVLAAAGVTLLVIAVSRSLPRTAV